jgi:hypothetical protein
MLSLVFVGGCVALTGIGDLSVGTDSDGGLPIGTIDLGDGSARLPDGHVIPIPDGGFPFPDGNFFDVIRPDLDADSRDTGPNPTDSGTGTNPSVVCGNVTCSGSKPVCCYYLSSVSCAAAPTQCVPLFTGYSCDDDSDCTTGNVCCVTASPPASQCAKTCSQGSQRACSSDQFCAQLGQGACSAPPFGGPPTIKSCAADGGQ